MKYLISMLAVAGFLFAFTPVDSETTINEVVSAETITVSGTLVDTKCYGMMPKANKGNTHVVMKDGKKAEMPNCATACANMGIPAAILTADGDVLSIVAPAGQLSDHMAKEARITGTVPFEGSLLPEKVEVKDGKKWVEVSIVTMM